MIYCLFGEMELFTLKAISRLIKTLIVFLLVVNLPASISLVEWNKQTIDSVGEVGWYTSIALDSSGFPQICHYDSANFSLKYSNWNGSSWDTKTVDSDFGAGTETSIVVDSSGSAHISYYEWPENDDLRYARWIGGSSTQPSIGINRTQLNFGSVVDGNSTGAQTLVISNTGTGTLNWSGADDKDWIATAPPFGSFDTPIDGSTVRSSVPVTGWVLDDIGVESVKIYREPINGEGSNLLYIGDAVFVEGARADVEMAYPTHPQNYQAGWGYMMLTNFLPNGGNGTFSLHAYATDKEGFSALLGTKTIICDNANAVKPFGAIDTPGQGEVVSGSFFNSGWALTPLPNKIPEDGSTINVWVDGQLQGHPAYNQFRNDIATLFPGYENSDGAVGAFYLDTTAYANGVHTIAWSVSDNAGNTDGIGSRFFTITNTGGSAVTQTKFQSPKIKMDVETSISFKSFLNLPVNFETIKYKRGFRVDAEPRGAEPNEYGLAVLEIREVERIEIYLGAAVSSGYMVVGEELRPLPIGSTLDVQKGTFTWQPGPGFLGQYELMFFTKNKSGFMKNIKIKIHVIPKY